MKKVLLFIICISFLIIPETIEANTLEKNIEIRSDNAIFINLNDDRILYEKNSEAKIYPASMTKIMTTLVAIESISSLEDTYVINNAVLEGLQEANASVAGFKIGQVVTYRDLLYGILLPSGADASRAIAISCFGSEEVFVVKMNEKANELEMNSTNFVNTSGLHDDEHYSSAKDISTLLKKALENDLFKDIYCTKTYQTSDQSLTFKSTLNTYADRYNLDVSYMLGAKTGYTNEASLCLASYSEFNGEQYIMVSAQTNSGSSYPYHVVDAITLYQYVFQHYSREVIVIKDALLKKVNVYWGSQDEYEIKAKSDISLLVKDKDLSNIKVKFKLDKDLEAPIYIESNIGDLAIYDDEQLIYEEDYKIRDQIDRHYIKYYIANIDQFFYDFRYLIIIMFISGVGLIVYKRLKGKRR